MQKSAILIPYSVQNAKYLHEERSLLMRKSFLVSKQITFMRMKMRSIVSFHFKRKSDLLYGLQGTYQCEWENANKSAFMQAEACMQKQAFNGNAA